MGDSESVEAGKACKTARVKAAAKAESGLMLQQVVVVLGCNGGGARENARENAAQCGMRWIKYSKCKTLPCKKHNGKINHNKNLEAP